MAKYTSEYPGSLILPDGEEITAGDEVNLDAKDEENVGVKQWIASGWLKPAKGAKKSDD